MDLLPNEIIDIIFNFRHNIIMKELCNEINNIIHFNCEHFTTINKMNHPSFLFIYYHKN